MPEIGATLREARMRARIDIAEIETATKIRAKYLRALENEEWELLPGPTFVKTFLRTYAEALGLDAKLLVDDYKMRHERVADSELRPISPRAQTASGRGSRRLRAPLRPAGAGAGGGRSPRGPITLVLVLLVLGILATIGFFQGDKGDRVADRPAAATPGTGTSTTPATRSGTATGTATGTAPTRRPKRRFATLRIQATGDVNVCLRARGQGTLLDGVLLRAGERSDTFRSTRFTLVLGNNAARLRVNDKTVRPPASKTPIGYLITPTRQRRLPADRQPSCS